MGAIYSLTDQSDGKDLLEVGGRGMSELMRFIDHPSTPGDRVSIFADLEYYGYDAEACEPVRFDASTVAKDADTILNALASLESDHVFGAFIASEWMEIFERVKAWALAHPDHVFRSQYYE